MRLHKGIACLAAFIFLFVITRAQQPAGSFILTVANEKANPLQAATVELINIHKLARTVLTDSGGNAIFINIAAGTYTFSITHTGYITKVTAPITFPSAINADTIQLQVAGTTLQQVTVSSKKSFIQHAGGKTLITIDAAISNTGTTVLEVLEKSPGVIVDKNGGLSLQGKTGVLVMIDDKPTYISGADLNNLLSSMSSSQVELIELIPNPPAKYDASGQAGIINIKTKRNKTKGFNGIITLAPGQGVYPKKNSSWVLNYHSGKVNLYLTYSINHIKYLSDIYALRKYYDENNNITALLDQPTYFTGNFLNNNLKTGIDYYVTPKTTVGLVLGGVLIHRSGTGNASATWLDAAGAVDSSIVTHSSSESHFKNGSINLNLRHSINKRQDISADVDRLVYNISSWQQFNNQLQTTGGYNEASRGNIPGRINISSLKVDYSLRIGKNYTILSGIKSSHIGTDNAASYQNFDGLYWQEDYGKSNQFLYKENINALYGSIESKQQQVSMQAGLRYEDTRYDANQAGNIQQKDSAFSRHYGALFPSGYISYRVDSSNSFTLTAGRRIDRPAFQNLNPFTFIINKYTYQTGNPFIVPQYSWNLELSHQYKEWLTNSVSYSVVKNYFSQLFLTDSITGLLYYSQGNVGRMYNIGLSSTIQLAPVKWWSFTLQVLYNYKELKGYPGNLHFHSDINQLNLNLTNQFTFAREYSGEISGYYTTRARNDLQEKLYATGQLSLGVSRPVLKKKATLKLSLRDIFYTSAMEGLTQFSKSTEYFIIRRDSRVINLAFTYRFGKVYKTTKVNTGSAADEMERVGSGG